MAIQQFDKINMSISLEEREVREKLKKYFEPMEITNEQKEERVDTSYQLYDVMLSFFALISTLIEFNRLERTYLLEKLREDFSFVAFEHLKADDYVTDYLDSIVEDITVVTLAHLSNADSPKNDFNTKDDNYYTSKERALIIAENEGNSIMNYSELQKAYEKGYTKKTWKTMRDKRVRDSHSKMEGVTLLLDEMFTVGNGEMMMPHDFENNPGECVNCRCSLKFYK